MGKSDRAVADGATDGGERVGELCPGWVEMQHKMDSLLAVGRALDASPENVAYLELANGSRIAVLCSDEDVAAMRSRPHWEVRHAKAKRHQ